MGSVRARVAISVVTASIIVGLGSCVQVTVSAPEGLSPVRFGLPIPYLTQYQLVDPLNQYPIVTRLYSPWQYPTAISWSIWLMDIGVVVLIIGSAQLVVALLRRRPVW